MVVIRSRTMERTHQRRSLRGLIVCSYLQKRYYSPISNTIRMQASMVLFKLEKLQAHEVKYVPAPTLIDHLSTTNKHVDTSCQS